MPTRIQKWGNSLGVRIPKALASEARLEPGTEVDVSVRDGRLIVTPLKPVSYSLEALLAGVHADNLHAEKDAGGRRGREAW